MRLDDKLMLSCGQKRKSKSNSHFNANPKMPRNNFFFCLVTENDILRSGLQAAHKKGQIFQATRHFGFSLSPINK
jgi:hypothetical protein